MNCKFFPKHKDGFYVIISKDDKEGEESCLVYLYDHPDFAGIRHISYFTKDGSATMPVSDIADTVMLIPVNIVPHLGGVSNDTTSQVELNKRTVDTMRMILLARDEN